MTLQFFFLGFKFPNFRKHVAQEKQSLKVRVQRSAEVQIKSSPSGSALPSLSGMVKTPTMVWPSFLSSLYTSWPNRLWPITAIFIFATHCSAEGAANQHRWQGSNSLFCTSSRPRGDGFSPLHYLIQWHDKAKTLQSLYYAKADLNCR